MATLSATVNCGAKTVGATTVQLTTQNIYCVNGVQVKAANANTGTIYVGGKTPLTAGTVDATDGFELGAGESLLLPVNDITKVYAIASAAGQKLFWAVV